MIPAFDDSGNLPPGIHPATLDEIETRFGRGSEIREAQMQSIRWLMALVIRAGIRRVILNGSFVTDIIEPNDVDCLLVVDSGMQNAPQAAQADAEIRSGLPYLDIQIGGQNEFDFFAKWRFARSRDNELKGMIEVVL